MFQNGKLKKYPIHETINEFEDIHYAVIHVTNKEVDDVSISSYDHLFKGLFMNTYTECSFRYIVVSFTLL